MAIPDNIIDQVRDRTDIVEVISSYIPLKKIGRNYKTTCPFHNEKTPSFVVSPDKQIYHCFGCNAGGNVFSFLMKYENMEFPEAVETLAKKAGIALPRSQGSRKDEDVRANQLYGVNESACKFFQDSLAGNKTAKEYLASRGLGDDMVSRFRIGFAPDSWQELIDFFKTKNVKTDILERAGLVVVNDKASHYDRFRNRITFPILDLKERILGFGARVLDASLPKYVNSPETPIYSKGKNLYGLNFSKEFIKKKNHVLVVEGYLDFLVPFQAGVNNIIATLGTAFTVDQLKLLKRHTNTVVMVYDPDEAGEAASLRNLDLVITEGMNVYIAELPVGFDPDGYIRKFGTDEFAKVIKASKNLFDYKIEKLAKRFNMNTMSGKANIASEMLPTISKIENAVLRSELVKKLAGALGVDEGSIREELKKVKPEHNEYRYMITPVEAKKDPHGAEMVILALSLDPENFIGKIAESLRAEDFKDSSLRDAMSVVLTLHGENRKATPAQLITLLKNSQAAANMISEASAILDTMDDKEKAFDDCVRRIKKDNIKERLSALYDAIGIAHNQKNEDKVRELMTEYNSLVKGSKA